jgi:hypothetical protein
LIQDCKDIHSVDIIGFGERLGENELVSHDPMNGKNKKG